MIMSCLLLPDVIYHTNDFPPAYLLQSLLLQPPLLLQLLVTSVGLLLLGAVGR